MYAAFSYLYAFVTAVTYKASFMTNRGNKNTGQQKMAKQLLISSC